MHPCCLFCEELPQDLRAPSEPTGQITSIMEDLDQSSERDANLRPNTSAVASAQPQPSMVACLLRG